MSDSLKSSEMSLTDAALRLRIPYAVAMRRMLRGELRGRRVDGRYWFVHVVDVERIAQQRHAATDATQPADR